MDSLKCAGLPNSSICVHNRFVEWHRHPLSIPLIMKL